MSRQFLLGMWNLFVQKAFKPASCYFTFIQPCILFVGAASETIYADAQFYWSMDSPVNIIDEKAERSGWAVVDGDLYQNVGVNGRSVEIKNGDGKMELLTDEFCFRKPRFCYDKGLTISFWFKRLETDGSGIEDRLFLQTTYEPQSLAGFFMYQESISGEIVFKTKGLTYLCVYHFNIEPNLWTFVAIVRYKSHWTIFLNGVDAKVEKVCSALDSPKNPDGKLVLGNGGSDSSVMFDDVAVWYRALEGHEVQTIYRYYYKGL